MIGQQARPQPLPLEVRFRKLEVSYHWAVAIAIIAIAALGVLLLWTNYGATAPQRDGALAAGNVVTAWSKGDTALMEAAYAEDAVLVSAGGGKYEGIDAIAGLSQAMYGSGFEPAVIGPIVQSGNTVVVPIRLTWGDGTVAYVTTILELDAAGKVVHHQDYGAPL